MLKYTSHSKFPQREEATDGSPQLSGGAWGSEWISRSALRSGNGCPRSRDCDSRQRY